MAEQVTDPDILKQLNAPSQVTDQEILRQLNAPQRGPLGKVPVLNYPEVYSEMNREAREQVGHGLEQVTGTGSVWERAKGVGNVALGSLGYVYSPLGAAYRSIVGEPIERTTGIPKEYPEFAASLATPGIGMTKMPLGVPKAPTMPSASAIKSAADAGYKSPVVSALKIRPEVMPMFGRQVTATLEQDFDPLLAPKTFGILEKRTHNIPEGSYVTAKNFDTLRRLLGEAAGSADKTERKVARRAMGLLDDFMAGIPDSAVIEGDATAARKILTDARGNYAAAMRTEELNDAVAKAGRQTSRTGFGGNWENYTRQKISQILDNPRMGRGLSVEEQQALQDYVDGNFTRNSLRVATKFLGGDNPLMAAIHGTLAWPTHGLSIAAPITGYMLKLLNDSISARQLNQINELLRSRSPLAEETMRAVTNWSRMGREVALDPSAQNAWRMTAAAQFLSDRFKKLGIDVDSSKLVIPAQDQQRTRGGVVRLQPRAARRQRVEALIARAMGGPVWGFDEGGSVISDPYAPFTRTPPVKQIVPNPLVGIPDDPIAHSGAAAYRPVLAPRPPSTGPTSSMGIRPEEHALSVNDILHPDTPEVPIGSSNIWDVAKGLHARGQAALKDLGHPTVLREENRTLETDETLARVMAHETKAAMEREGHAADWYRGNVQRAMKIGALVYPEIATDPNAAFAFRVAHAITSQNEKVPSNVRMTDYAYNYYRDNGRFPTDIKASKQAMINGNFQKINHLLDTLGPEETLEFMHKEFTARELEDMGYKTGFNKEDKVYGSAILGPKIGQGFYQNLSGNFDPVTTDLWFTRTWGRLTGTLSGFPNAVPQARDRFERALAEQGHFVPEKIGDLNALADDVVRTHEADYRKNQPLYKSGEKQKSELTYAAERLQHNLHGIKEQPSSASERGWMASVVQRARDILRGEGHSMSNADLQALIWYPEKDLYAKLGSNQDTDRNMGYDTAWRAKAIEKGVPNDAIERAIRSLE